MDLEAARQLKQEILDELESARNSWEFQFLTVREVAIVLGVSKSTVYRRIHSGKLFTPQMTLDRSFRISGHAVQEYLRTVYASDDTVVSLPRARVVKRLLEAFYQDDRNIGIGVGGTEAGGHYIAVRPTADTTNLDHLPQEIAGVPVVIRSATGHVRALSLAEQIAKFVPELVEEARKFVSDNFPGVHIEQYNAQVLTYCVAFDASRINGLEIAGVLPKKNDPPRPYPGEVMGEVWDIIGDSLPSHRGRWQWLTARNPLLGNTPFNAILAGRYDETRAAARAFIDGSYV